MKRLFLSILLILISIFIFPIHSKTIYADEQSSVINTYYPNDILDYYDLENISHLAINDNFIAFSQSDNILTIFSINSKTYKTISDYNHINEIKFINNNQLIVTTYNADTTSGEIKLLTFDNDLNYQPTTINIAINNLKVINFYQKLDATFIAIICNNTFSLYKLESGTINNIYTHSSNLYYHTAFQISFNSNSIFVAYKNAEENLRLDIFNYSLEEQIIPITYNLLDKVKLIDTYNINNRDYLIAFTVENLSVFSLNNITTDSFTTAVSIATNLDMNDLVCFNNSIYFSDSNSKSIQSYYIDETNQLKKQSTLLCSYGKDLGRFNGVTDIFIQGETLIVSDSKNTRIQMFVNNTPYELSNLTIDSFPHSAILTSKNELYFVKKTAENTSSLEKYFINNNTFTYSNNSYNTYDATPLGLISDTTINNEDIIYLIDYTNNKLLYLTSLGLQELFTLPFETNVDTEIEYLKDTNQLIILNNNIIYLYNDNPTNNQYINCLTLSCRAITTDTNKIYALQDNSIKSISTINNILSLETNYIYNEEFGDMSTITFDILNQKMYGFSEETKSIKFFDCSLNVSPLTKDDFTAVDYEINISMPIGMKINNNDIIIYSNKYHLGTQYFNIDKCIAIQLEDNYYRVIFNYNNKLLDGYIDKKDTTNGNITIQSFSTTNKIKVLATNQFIPVYKYPTLLPYQNEDETTKIVTIDSLPINKSITVTYNHFPISIDGKNFYMYESDSYVGFIFGADIVLDDSKNITYLNTENATVNTLTEDNIYMYNENGTIIMELEKEQRIYVEYYNKKSEYTKVIYKDSSLNTVEGFVKTKYVNMDKLDDTKIVLILIICLSVGILFIILSSYLILRKKKK